MLTLNSTSVRSDSTDVIQHGLNQVLGAVGNVGDRGRKHVARGGEQQVALVGNHLGDLRIDVRGAHLLHIGDGTRV